MAFGFADPGPRDVAVCDVPIVDLLPVGRVDVLIVGRVERRLVVIEEDQRALAWWC